MLLGSSALRTLLHGQSATTKKEDKLATQNLVSTILKEEFNVENFSLNSNSLISPITRPKKKSKKKSPEKSKSHPSKYSSSNNYNVSLESAKKRFLIYNNIYDFSSIVSLSRDQVELYEKQFSTVMYMVKALIRKLEGTLDQLTGGDEKLTPNDLELLLESNKITPTTAPFLYKKIMTDLKIYENVSAVVHFSDFLALLRSYSTISHFVQGYAEYNGLKKTSEEAWEEARNGYSQSALLLSNYADESSDIRFLNNFFTSYQDDQHSSVLFSSSSSNLLNHHSEFDDQSTGIPRPSSYNHLPSHKSSLFSDTETLKLPPINPNKKNKDKNSSSSSLAPTKDHNTSQITSNNSQSNNILSDLELLRRELKESNEQRDKYSNLVDQNIAWVHNNLDLSEFKATISERAKNKCKKLAIQKIFTVFDRLLKSIYFNSFYQWKMALKYEDVEKDVKKYCKIKSIHSLTATLSSIYLKNIHKYWVKLVLGVRAKIKRERFLAAVLIQKTIRRFIAKRRVDYLRKFIAARKIQCSIRSNLARKRLIKVRHEKKLNDSAAFIQRNWKSHYNVVTAKRIVMEKRRNKASIMIQKVVRGKLGRKRFLNIMNNAQNPQEEEKKEEETIEGDLDAIVKRVSLRPPLIDPLKARRNKTISTTSAAFANRLSQPKKRNSVNSIASTNNKQGSIKTVNKSKQILKQTNQSTKPVSQAVPETSSLPIEESSQLSADQNINEGQEILEEVREEVPKEVPVIQKVTEDSSDDLPSSKQSSSEDTSPSNSNTDVPLDVEITVEEEFICPSETQIQENVQNLQTDYPQTDDVIENSEVTQDLILDVQQQEELSNQDEKEIDNNEFKAEVNNGLDQDYSQNGEHPDQTQIQNDDIQEQEQEQDHNDKDQEQDQAQNLDTQDNEQVQIEDQVQTQNIDEQEKIEIVSESNHELNQLDDPENIITTSNAEEEVVLAHDTANSEEKVDENEVEENQEKVREDENQECQEVDSKDEENMQITIQEEPEEIDQIEPQPTDNETEVVVPQESNQVIPEVELESNVQIEKNYEHNNFENQNELPLAHSEYENLPKDDLTDENASISIQKIIRSKLARLKVDDIKRKTEEEKQEAARYFSWAIGIIQKVIRGFLGRRKYKRIIKQKYDEINRIPNAAIKIQSVFRGYNDRQTYASIKAQHDAEVEHEEWLASFDKSGRFSKKGKSKDSEDEETTQPEQPVEYEVDHPFDSDEEDKEIPSTEIINDQSEKVSNEENSKGQDVVEPSQTLVNLVETGEDIQIDSSKEFVSDETIKPGDDLIPVEDEKNEQKEIDPEAIENEKEIVSPVTTDSNTSPDINEIEEKLKLLQEIEKKIKESEEKVKEENRLTEEKLRQLEERERRLNSEKQSQDELMRLILGNVSARSVLTARNGSNLPSARSAREAPIPADAPRLTFRGLEWVQLWDTDEKAYYWWCPTTKSAQWEQPGLEDYYSKFYQQKEENLDAISESGYESSGAVTDYSTDLDSNSYFSDGEYLEDEWQEYWDEAAQAKYWYNNQTGEATWTLPESLAANSSSYSFSTSSYGSASSNSSGYASSGTRTHSEHDGWTSYLDEATGQLYWHNSITNEVEWDY